MEKCSIERIKQMELRLDKVTAAMIELSAHAFARKGL